MPGAASGRPKSYRHRPCSSQAISLHAKTPRNSRDSLLTE